MHVQEVKILKNKNKIVNWSLFDILQSDWPEKSIPTSIVIWPTLPTRQVWGSLIKGNSSYHKKTNVWCPPNLIIRFHLVNKLMISENIISLLQIRSKLFYFEIDVLVTYGMLHVKKMISGTLEMCELCCNI